MIPARQRQWRGKGQEDKGAEKRRERARARARRQARRQASKGKVN